MRLRRNTIAVVAVLVGLSLCVGPALAVDATQWGSGVYSLSMAPGWDESSYPVWHYDITMTLQPLNFISSLPQITDEWADPAYEWRFTGMVWQPDGGNLLNHFMWDTYASTDLPKDAWTQGYDLGPPASDANYAQSLSDGFVGVFVDDDGTLTPSKITYDIIAEDSTEFSYGIALDATQQKTVSFSVNIWLPKGPGAQNAQMGWTGYPIEPDTNPNPYKRAQNSKYLTPELPPSALLSLTMLPWGIAYLRGRRRKQS